ACIAVQRVVLETPIAEEFERKLADRMGELTVGDPRSIDTRVAPVINEASANRIRGMIDRATAEGARLVGEANRGEGNLIPPTLLADVPHTVDLWNEEIFGPVVCLSRVESIDEAISVVNNSRYGLQASVFTASLDTAFRAINELEVGGVVVNEIPG